MVATIAGKRWRGLSTGAGVRPEIQALRAAAVTGVLLYHLWPDRLPGGFVGVDVFFVVSGFLITDHLLREYSRAGRISLPRFWARRARRLLPASLLVLLLTALGVWLWVPDTRWAQFGAEIIWSSLYVENWALAAQSVDYMALSNVKSPVQHFWSLGVEEQFYVLWPLAVVAAYMVARRFGRDVVSAVGVALGIATGLSLLYSVILTAVSPTVAYFSTFTRAWEFGAGALLAVAGARGLRRLPLRWAATGSWAGFACILLTMFVFDAHTPFPSFTAILPIIGTLLVIVSGSAHTRFAPTRLYSISPVQFAGSVSYGVYLWHWPLIVLAPYALRSPSGPLVSLAIIAVSFLLGWLSKVVVEDPVRERSFLTSAQPRWSFSGAAVAMAVTLSAALPLAFYTVSPPPVLAPSARGECYGASSIVHASCGPVERVPMISSLSSFALDLPPADILMCETGVPAASYQRCEFGDSNEDSGADVALLGDSHATRWVEAIREAVHAAGGRLSTFLVSGCASVTRDLTGSAWGFDLAYAETCRDTSARMIEEIAGDRSIDTVILTNRTRLYVTDEAQFHPLGAASVADTIGRFQQAGKRVVVLADPPELNALPTQASASAADCLTNAPSPEDCSLPRNSVKFDDPMRAGAAIAGAQVVELDDLFCDDARCMSRIGGLVVYSDDNHLSRSYARSLASILAKRLQLG